jgi:hypothetical protein
VTWMTPHRPSTPRSRQDGRTELADVLGEVATQDRAQTQIFGRSDSLLERWKILHGDRRQGRESVSEYSSSCIGMRADEVLISADPGCAARRFVISPA